MNLDIQTLNDHGILVVNNLLSEDKVQPIALKLQTIISNLYPTELPKTSEDAEPWVAAKSKLQRSKDMINLMNNEINLYMKNVLKLDIQPVKSCQIAARFPLEGTNKEWHIDNFTEKDLNRSFNPSEFDYLVGIYLTNNESDNCGNFTCYPGGHHQTRAYCRNMNDDENVVYNTFRIEGLAKIRSELKLWNEHQLKCKIGSVLIADRMLPHLICAPNSSNDIRIIIFFRTKLVNHNLKDMLFGKQKDSVATDIELRGLGYLKDTNIYRIKPRILHHVPNAIASMVEIEYDKYLLSIHTSGFLSKVSHYRWVNKLRNCSLEQVINQINNVDYKELIEEFCPNVEPCGGYRTIEMTFHHVHSSSKSSIIRSWNKDIEIKIGSPGFMKFTEQKSIADMLLNRILCFHWNKKPKVVIS